MSNSSYNFNIILLIIIIIQLVDTFVLIENLKNNEKSFSSFSHSRMKRTIFLTRKIDRTYQECIAPGNLIGHCKHQEFCDYSVYKQNPLKVFSHLCIIENKHIGVCCPDSLINSTIYSGQNLIANLPETGDAYDSIDERTNLSKSKSRGCGLPTNFQNTESLKDESPEWPWIAAILRDKDVYFCGGVLITDKHILTAAHCTYFFTATELTVRLGEYNLDLNNETRSRDFNVTEIIQHVDFSLPTYFNDIAILKMDRSTSFNSYIWPICLPPADLKLENEMGYVIGWGMNSFDGIITNILMEVSVPIWNHSTCVEAFTQRITDKNLCAAAFEGGRDSCRGDSGGPLMHKLKNGRWVNIGIVSWGLDCGKPKHPGVYTKVNEYLDWIMENTIS